MASYRDTVLATAGLVAYWRFNEASGSVADETGAHPGSVIGSVTRGQPGLLVGDPDKAYTFGTAGAYVSVPDHTDFASGTVTIEALINITSWTSGASVMNRRTTGNVGGWTFQIDSANQFYFYCYIGGAWRGLLTTGWTTGVTWHMAATYDGTTMRVYRNGVQVGSLAQAGAINNPASALVQIGKEISGSGVIAGTVDEPAIYVLAQSVATILVHAQAAATDPPPKPSAAPVVVKTRGALAVTTTLWVADRYGKKIARVATRKPINGVVTANEDTEIKRQMSLTVNDPRAFVPFQTFLIPEVTISDPYGMVTTAQFGHFIVTQPTIISRRGRSYGTVEGQSALEWMLSQAQVGGFTGLAGRDSGDVVRDLFMTLNPDPNQLSIPQTGVILTADWKPDPGLSLLKAGGNLLQAANHYVPWGDAQGVVRTRPYKDIASTPATLRWHTEEGVALLPEIQEAPSYERLRNAVVVRRLQPDKEPIYWKARITNQTHPLYYDPQNPNVGIGIEMAGTPVDNNDVETQAQAKALAESLLSEGASFYRKLDLGTLIDMKADLHDIIDLNVQDGPIAAPLYTGKWWRRTWKLELKGVTATMDNELYRTENWR